MIKYPFTPNMWSDKYPFYAYMNHHESQQLGFTVHRCKKIYETFKVEKLSYLLKDNLHCSDECYEELNNVKNSMIKNGNNDLDIRIRKGWKIYGTRDGRSYYKKGYTFTLITRGGERGETVIHRTSLCKYVSPIYHRHLLYHYDDEF